MTVWSVTRENCKPILVCAEGPLDAIKETYPAFRWVFGRKRYGIPQWTYSGPEGWVEVVVVEQSEQEL